SQAPHSFPTRRSSDLDSGAGTGFAAGVRDFGAQKRAQSRFDKCPRAHVLRFFLAPDELRTFRIWLEDFAQPFFCKWVKLLYANRSEEHTSELQSPYDL